MRLVAFKEKLVHTVVLLSLLYMHLNRGEPPALGWGKIPVNPALKWLITQLCVLEGGEDTALAWIQTLVGLP